MGAKGARTRARLAAAALEAVAELGYERASVREIARRADVDPNLIRLYFGSKERLLLSALAAGLEAPDPGDTGDPGEAALRRFAARWEGDGVAMRALVRASMTNEEAAALFRTVMDEPAIDPARATHDEPDVQLRASLVGAFLLGLGVYRHLLRMPHVATADGRDIEALVAPALDALLATGRDRRGQTT